MSQRVYLWSMPCSIYWSHAASCNQIYSSESQALIPSEPVVWQVRHQSWNLLQPCLSPGFFSTSDLHLAPSQNKQGQCHCCSLQSTLGPTNSTSSTFLVGVEKAKIVMSNYNVSELPRSVYLSNISPKFPSPRWAPQAQTSHFLNKFNAIKPDCYYGIAPAGKRLIQEGKRGKEYTVDPWSSQLARFVQRSWRSLCLSKFLQQENLTGIKQINTRK